MRRAAIALLGLLLGVTSSAVGIEARQPSPSPVIHRVTLLPGDGVLVIEGTGLGDHLVVTLNGQAVTTLPGATETRMDAQAPAAVLTTAGTYRLTVADPLRRAWDGFIVASAPETMTGIAPAAVTSSPGTPGGDIRSGAAAGAPAATPSPSSHGVLPLTVIEDPGSPFRTALGFQALSANTTGVNNTGIGYHALQDVTTGSSNTAVGMRALAETVDNLHNTAVGFDALRINEGNNNTAVGSQALSGNISGHSNVAIGDASLGNASGDRNIGIGSFAGTSVTTGNDNIIIGSSVSGQASDTNTIRIGKPLVVPVLGGQNRAFIAGIRGTTLSSSLDGVYIDAAGQLGSGPVVPANDTVGSAQVIADSLTAADLAFGAVGNGELADNAVTASKVAFNYAGSTSEGGAASDLACAGCVAAGEVSFAFAGLGANTFGGTQTIGAGNVDLAASSATAGNLTKAGARFLHDPGFQNTFLGWTSANFTLTGEDNTGLGAQALRNVVDGSNNTGVGSTVLWRTTSGADNTASGYRALFDTTTGSRNTALGTWAGASNTTGSDNIYLGANVLGTATDANTMRIGLPFNATSGEGQIKTFIAGIHGTVLTTPVLQVFVDANGQLGTLVPPIILTSDGPLSTNPRPDAALVQQVAEQRALIAELRQRLAALEAQVAARSNRR